MVAVTSVHLEGWALLRCRGALAPEDVIGLAALLDRECATDQHVAVDLLAATSADESLVPTLAQYPTAAVVSSDPAVAEPLRAAGLAVYESLDQATGNHAATVRRLHDHLREDPRPGSIGADFVAAPDPVQPRASH